MADFVFDIAKGAVAEKVRDSATVLGVMVLKTAEADATLKTRATLTAVTGANTEANFTNYARKTGITGTLTVDTSGHTASVTMGNQTWTSAGGGTNNTLAKLIIYYDEGGTDGTRIPLTGHDFVVTTDGTDLIAQVNASGFFSAS